MRWIDRIFRGRNKVKSEPCLVECCQPDVEVKVFMVDGVGRVSDVCRLLNENVDAPKRTTRIGTEIRQVADRTWRATLQFARLPEAAKAEKGRGINFSTAF